MTTSHPIDPRHLPLDWTATCNDLPPDSRPEATIRNRGATVARIWTSPTGGRVVELLACGARNCLIAYS